MSKKEQLIDRFLRRPKDFTWDELVNMLRVCGYSQVSGGKTGGSRARFIQDGYPPITLHRPHPKPILKRYQMDELFNFLKQERLL